MRRAFAFTPEQRAQIETGIRARLATHGVCSTHALAQHLDLTPRQIGWFCGQLRTCGQLALVQQASKPTQAWWGLDAGAGQGEEVCTKQEKWTPDPEHAAWMAYWQQPRAVRLRPEARGHAD